jgi:Flp pilus assembly protein TadD
MRIRRPLAGKVTLVLLALALPGCAADKAGQQSQIFSLNRGAQGPFEKFSSKIAGWGSTTAAAEVSEPAADSKNVKPDPYTVARLCERRGQPAQAESLYKTAIERYPNKVGPYHRLGVMRAQQRRFREADEYFAKALAIAPNDPVLLGDAGYCQYLQHNLDQAEQLLRRAVDANPRDPLNGNNLAIVLAEKGAYDEALVVFKRVGSESQAYANLAFIYSQQGHVDRAKANYNHALTLDPKMRPAAEALTQLSKYEGAQHAMITPGRSIDRGAVAASSYEAPARLPGRAAPPADAQRAVLVTTTKQNPPVQPPAAVDNDIPMPKIGFSDRDAEAVIQDIASGKVTESGETADRIETASAEPSVRR